MWKIDLHYYCYSGVITGLDFDPEGRLIATITNKGHFLISHVDTNKCEVQAVFCSSEIQGIIYIQHYKSTSFLEIDRYARCRWDGIKNSSQIYFKHNERSLNVFDVEKKTPLNATPDLLRKQSKSANFICWMLLEHILVESPLEIVPPLNKA